MLAFCAGMMGYFAYSLTDVVGGPCDGSQDRYPDYEHCWNLKENWCARMQCAADDGQAMGSAIDSSSPGPGGPPTCARRAASVAPRKGRPKSGSSSSNADAVSRAHSRRSECPPDDGLRRLARELPRLQTAHPSSQQSAAEAFIQRDAFLDACDAQAVYADRREKGGTRPVMAMHARLAPSCGWR